MSWKLAARTLLLFSLLTSGCGGDDDDQDDLGGSPVDTTWMTVLFTVTGAPGDSVNSGANASGSFSFDESIIPPSGGPVRLPTIRGFNLHWDGTTWNDENTGAGNGLPGLVFDSTGTVTDFFIWGDPTGHAMDGSDFAPDDFWMAGDGFVYHREGVFGNGVDASPFVGDISWVVAVPANPAPRGLLDTAPARLIAPP